MSLVTVECSVPRASYDVFPPTGAEFDVHLAGPTERGGTGPCLCGFDRHARDESGRSLYGFSVGGGVTGPGYRHRVCWKCVALIGGEKILGTHRQLFEVAKANREALLKVCDAVDELVGVLPSEVGCTTTFRIDMEEALTGDQIVPFTVQEVLDALFHWTAIAVRRMGVTR